MLLYVRSTLLVQVVDVVVQVIYVTNINSRIAFTTATHIVYNTREGRYFGMVSIANEHVLLNTPSGFSFCR